MTNSLHPEMARVAAQPVSACPLCSSPDIHSLYKVENIPVQSCVVLSDYNQAINFERRHLELFLCHKCGFVFNGIFDRRLVDYFQVTEESQHFSGTFNRFSRDLAKEIAEECEIDGKTIVEVGCGKGEFLAELCSHADCKGIGIDPGFREDRLQTISSDPKLRFIAEYFDADKHAFDPDVILCRHTLEHIPDVANFMAQIRAGIGAQDNIKVFFETPDAKRVLEEGAFWDIYYEHCSYFTEGTHASLFHREGFTVYRSALGYDDQYILQYAKPVASGTAGPTPLHDHGELMQIARAFPERVRAVQAKWRDLVKQRHGGGQRVVAWGGGSKCVSFVTTLGLGEEIDYVVDINPYKQSKFLPGTGHRVVAPTELQNSPPDLVIVMNPIYIAEIQQSLAEMGLSPEVIAV